MVGKLTTHVLDTTCGLPAPGLLIELWLINNQSVEKTLLKTTITNWDRQMDAPLLVNDEFQSGIYELVFITGSYFAERLNDSPNQTFLDHNSL